MHNTRCLECGKIGDVNIVGLCEECSRKSYEEWKAGGAKNGSEGKKRAIKR